MGGVGEDQDNISGSYPLKTGLRGWRDTERERQTDRQTETERKREREREREREIKRER